MLDKKNKVPTKQTKPFRPTEPTIEWNDQGQPISKRFDDVYFSTEHGLNESRYIFLKNNNLPERWTKSSSTNKPCFTIFETGFGSGLNFLSTWQAWLSCKSKLKYKKLHFISVEKYPLTLQELKKASILWPELKNLSDQLIEQYPPQPAKGLHRLNFNNSLDDKLNNSSIKLSLYFGDVKDSLDSLYVSNLNQGIQLSNANLGEHPCTIDAWYLDGFTPAKNPEMWHEDIFKHMSILSQQSALSTFSTFTSATHIRKGLTHYGFECKKVSGFGLKREMLCGIFKGCPKNTTNENISNNTNGNKVPPETLKKTLKKINYFHTQKHQEPYWLLQSYTKGFVQNKKKDIYDVIIIGGGLSGCHSAFALANRGLRVLIIEKDDALAKHASGNAQGLVYTRLSHHNDALSEFNILAQTFSDQFYRKNNLYITCGEDSGIFHCAHNEKLEKHYKAIDQLYALTRTEDNLVKKSRDAFAQWVDKEHTEELCGIPLQFGGLFLKKSGWLNPPELCKKLTHHPNISVIHNKEIYQVEKTDDNHSNWHCFDSDKNLIGHAKHIVIANAIDAKKFEQSAHLPLKSIRGQVSYLAANKTSSKLRVPVCGEGYIAPKIKDTTGSEYHSLGASFNLYDDSKDMNQSDQNDNFEKLSKIIPSVLHNDIQNVGAKLQGRVSFRTTSPDYFPIVGPVPHEKNTLSTFAALRKNAKTMIAEPGQFYAGLYCNLAMGSRGLAYAPLCAELLADLIVGDFLAVEKNMYKHLNPSRFLIRSLKRSKH